MTRRIDFRDDARFSAISSSFCTVRDGLQARNADIHCMEALALCAKTMSSSHSDLSSSTAILEAAGDIPHSALITMSLCYHVVIDLMVHVRRCRVFRHDKGDSRAARYGALPLNNFQRFGVIGSLSAAVTDCYLHTATMADGFMSHYTNPFQQVGSLYIRLTCRSTLEISLRAAKLHSWYVHGRAEKPSPWTPGACTNCLL
jgi:hypothetical protein